MRSTSRGIKQASLTAKAARNIVDNSWKATFERELGAIESEAERGYTSMRMILTHDHHEKVIAELQKLGFKVTERDDKPLQYRVSW